MFTGLIADLGTVVAREGSDSGVRLSVSTALASQLAPGDSIAVNGVCLTANRVDGDRFTAEVMNETLSRSSLADAAVGAQVNLELPLRASDRLGGHIVQGHVDAVGRVAAVSDDGFARRVTIAAPAELMRYVVQKGSIAVDGVSLTVAARDGAQFQVSLIPETLARTTLGAASVGRQVNLEVDMVAKYVENLIAPGRDEAVENLIAAGLAGRDEVVENLSAPESAGRDEAPAIHSASRAQPSGQSPQTQTTGTGRTST